MPLEKAILSALQLGNESIPMVRTKKAKNQYISGYTHKTTRPTVEDQIARIHSEADPVQFLLDVLAGKAFEEYSINPNGTINEGHVTPSMAQRIKVAEFLTEKIIPKMTVHKRIIEEPQRPTWTKLITDASNKAE